MNLLLTLAWRYLNGRKLRTFLTTLAVVFGVMVTFGMNIILPTMLQSFQANMLAAGGVVDVTVTQNAGTGFPLGIARKLEGIAGLRAVSPLLERTVNLPADFVDRNPAVPDRITAVSLAGVDPQAAQALQAYLIQPGGRFLTSGDGAAVVISQTLADAYGVKLGGQIRLPTVAGVQALTVVGILPPRTLPGNEQVLVTLAEAQTLTGMTGQVNTLDVRLTSLDQAARDRATAAIRAALGSDYTVGAIQSDSSVFASIRLAQQAFNLFGVLALFMGAFIIFNTFRTVVIERRRDIGMLRALGARRSTVTGIILVEGLLQGLIGSAFGLLLGYLMGAGVVALAGPAMARYIDVKMGSPVVTPTLVITSALLGVGITVLAGLLPARSAARVTPMEALRPSLAEVEYRRRSLGGFIAGLVLIVVSLLGLVSGNMGLIALGGLLFLAGLILIAPLLLRPIAFIFGRLTAWLYAHDGTGDLAQGNLTRQPERVTITASATLIGLAIIVALGGMTTSLNGMMGGLLHKTLGSDYLFVPPSVAVWSSDIGAGSDLADRLRAVPGVAAVSSLRYSASLTDGQTVSVLGIDPLAFPQVSGLDFNQGNDSAYAALAAGRNLIANGALMGTLGLKVGDTIALATRNGTQDYKVVAVGADLLNAKVVTAYISQANLAADFGRTDDVFIQLNLKPGVRAADVDTAIRAAAADYPQFTIIAGKVYIDQMMQLLGAIFAGMYFLFLFLAFPSLIAMLNTQAINVLERTREIGMLRAVGATRRQVRTMVLAEALLLAGIGTTFGILAGLYLGYVLVAGMSTLFPMTYYFPFTGILAGIAFGLLFGALAAFIPAHQAARLPVVEALRYE